MNLDSLEILVSANTTKAVLAIKNLTRSLRSLRNVFKATTDENKETIRNFKSFARVLTKISQIDFSKTEKSLVALAEIAKKVNLKKVGDFADAEKMLNGLEKAEAKPAVDETENISQIAEEKDWIDKLGFSIEKTATLRRMLENEAKTLGAEEIAVLKEQVKDHKELEKIVGKLQAQQDKLTEKSKKLGDIFASFGKKLKGRVIFKILQTIINLVIRLAKEVVDRLYNVADKRGSVIAKKLDELKTALEYFKNSLATVIAPLMDVLVPVLTKVLEIFSEIAQVAGKIISTLFDSKEIVEATEEATKFNKELEKSTTFGIDELNVLDDRDETKGLDITGDIGKESQLASMVGELLDTIKGVISEVLDYVKELVQNIKPILSPLLEIVGKLLKLFTKLGEPLLNLIVNVVGVIAKVLEPILNLISLVIDLILDAISPILDGLIVICDELLTPVLNLFSGIFAKAVETVAGIFSGLINTFKKIFGSLGDILGITDKLGKSGAVVGMVFGAILLPLTAIAEVINKILTTIGIFFEALFTWRWDKLRQVGNVWGDWSNLQASLDGIKANAQVAFSYSTGGFPEDGIFYANHNELVGQFSNGKTAVANNAQIIEGIKQGVMEAMQATNGGCNVNVLIDSEEIASRVEERQNNRGSTLITGRYLNYGK